MSENSTLKAIYENWKAYQALIIKAVAPLSEEQLELRAAPNLRTIEQIARHMTGTRASWFKNALEEGDEQIAAIAAWNRPAAPKQSAKSIVAAMETTTQMIQDALARWSDADLEYVFRGNWRGEPYAISRQWVIWHLIEHDLHHGGELSLTLGMHGLAAADL